MNYEVKAIIFDMDGVIIDTTKEIEIFWKDWAAREKIILNEELIRKFIHGRTASETIEELFYNSTSEVKELIAISSGNFDNLMRPGLIDGASDFLYKLSKENIPLGLVTSSPKERVKPLLDQHNIYHYFEEIITGDDVTNGKPHPEPYLKAAAKLKNEGGQCLVFEDSDSGISSGLAAGMYVVSVNNDHFQHDNIVAGIKSFTELEVGNKKITCNTTPYSSIFISQANK